jgi:hypothetical protein
VIKNWEMGVVVVVVVIDMSKVGLLGELALRLARRWSKVDMK